MAIAVSSRNIKSVGNRVGPPEPPAEKLSTRNLSPWNTELRDLRRRCIQVTGGACKTMEAYNLAKLQQSAMPMDWGKRGAETPANNVDGAADAIIDTGDAAKRLNKDMEAKALLFFLRPESKAFS